MAINSYHLEHAAQLLDRGFISLPLRKGGKHLDLAAMGYAPLHLDTKRKALKEALFEGITIALSQKLPPEQDIIRWFEGFDGNLGILTGYNGLIVLDFDNKAVFDSWQLKHEGVVSCTPVARTPRGVHVYFRSETPILTSSMYLGWRRIGHIKSLAGYVVSSPSILSDGSSYSWLPGQSPLECRPQPIASLQSLTLRSCSPIKEHYDRLLHRGYFRQE